MPKLTIAFQFFTNFTKLLHKIAQNPTGLILFCSNFTQNCIDFT